MSQNEQSPDLRDQRFPESEQAREAFMHSELRPLRRTPWIIADRRLQGSYGAFDGPPQRVSWRSREANRYITELYRQRELSQVKISIYVAIIIGLFALAATVLAMPTEKSVLSWSACSLFGSLCDAVSTGK